MGGVRRPPFASRPERLARFEAAIRRDLDDPELGVGRAVRETVMEAVSAAVSEVRSSLIASNLDADALREQVALADRRRAEAEAFRSEAEAQNASLTSGRAYRLASRLSAAATAARRVTGRSSSPGGPSITS